MDNQSRRSIQSETIVKICPRKSLTKTLIPPKILRYTAIMPTNYFGIIRRLNIQNRNTLSYMNLKYLARFFRNKIPNCTSTYIPSLAAAGLLQ